MQLNVDDVAAAVTFYRSLGMTEREDRPDIGIDGAWLDCGAQQIHLLALAAPTDQGQHFALEVDDLDALVTRLRGAGVDVTEPHALGPGLPRQASLHDPSGNRVEIREPAA